MEPQVAKRQESLGQVQLEVLQYVADHYPIRVGEVADHFAETKGKARTTILTVMEKLREKGYLKRKKINRTYHYSPRLGKNDVMASVVHRFVQETLGGSISPFIAYLAGSRELSDDELGNLQELVRELETHRKEER
jgi:predicted transcriptional regulator